MKKRRLLESWNEYKDKVVPKEASASQVEETRRAFWGGAGTLFAILTGEISATEEVTEPDMDVLDDVNAEINEFFEEMKRLAQAQAQR
jgi:hypothetical protein